MEHNQHHCPVRILLDHPVLLERLRVDLEALSVVGYLVYRQRGTPERDARIRLGRGEFDLDAVLGRRPPAPDYLRRPRSHKLSLSLHFGQWFALHIVLDGPLGRGLDFADIKL